MIEALVAAFLLGSLVTAVALCVYVRLLVRRHQRDMRVANEVVNERLVVERDRLVERLRLAPAPPPVRRVK